MRYHGGIVYSLTALASASLIGCGPSRMCVVAGDDITMPIPIANADEYGYPGGDAIESMKLVIVSSSPLVVNPVESETLKIPPGESKTFKPRFTVAPHAAPGDKFDLKLHFVSPDAGIDPDPDSPESDISIHLIVRKKCFVTKYPVRRRF